MPEVVSFQTWCDWVSCRLGNFGGFAPINRGPGLSVDTFQFAPKYPKCFQRAFSEKERERSDWSSSILKNF